MFRLLRRVPYLIPLFLLASSVSQATPLRLDYTKDYHGNGLTYYNFTLTLMNQDDSWTPGQGFSWIIFGDAPSLGDGAFANFAFISSSGHWDQVTMPNGPYNGVLLGPPTQTWTPGQVGDFISWRGSSTTDALDGSIFFSALNSKGSDIHNAPARDVSPDKQSPFTVLPNSSSSSSSSSGGSSSGGINDPVVEPLATPEPATIAMTALVLAAVSLRRKS